MKALERTTPLLLVLLGFSICVGCRNSTNSIPEATEKENATINLSAITGFNETQMFTAVTDASLLPKTVLAQLGRIASRGQAFNTTDIVDPALPSRQLVAAALSAQYCIVSYWEGGVTVRFGTAVFTLSDDGAALIWFSEGQGGLNFRDLKQMVESGRMRNDLTNQNPRRR